MAHSVQALAPQTAATNTSSVQLQGKGLPAVAQEFESVLLGQWLQGAETSFGSVEGSDEDSDSCGEQMRGFALQRLAGQFSAAGGIGIARMVEKALTKASQDASSKGQESAHAAGSGSISAAGREQGLDTAVQAYSMGAER